LSSSTTSGDIGVRTGLRIAFTAKTAAAPTVRSGGANSTVIPPVVRDAVDTTGGGCRGRVRMPLRSMIPVAVLGMLAAFSTVNAANIPRMLIPDDTNRDFAIWVLPTGAAAWLRLSPGRSAR
jgi:hypothetical protein